MFYHAESGRSYPSQRCPINKYSGVHTESIHETTPLFIHQSSYHHHEFLCAEGELEGDVSACSRVVRQLALSVHTLEHVVFPQSDADQPAP